MRAYRRFSDFPSNFMTQTFGKTSANEPNTYILTRIDNQPRCFRGPEREGQFVSYKQRKNNVINQFLRGFTQIIFCERVRELLYPFLCCV